jgi:hypothetical protein
MAVIQRILGHSKISTTADIYAGCVPALERDAIGRLGALLEAGQNPVGVPVGVSPKLLSVAGDKRT